MVTMSGVSNTQPLRDLIEGVMREEGWALNDLARNSRGLRQKSWFGKVITAEHRPTLLRDDELEALAAGLRVSVKVVRTADLAGHGLREITAEDPPRMPEVADLTPRQRAAVQAVIRAMVQPDEPAESGEESKGDVAPVLPMTRAARKRPGQKRQT